MPAMFVKGDFINELPKGTPRAFACPVDVSGRSDAGIASAVAKRWPGFGEWWAAQKKQVGDLAVFEAEGDIVFALVLLRGAKRSKLAWLERTVRAMLAEAAKRNVIQINVARLWGGPSGLDGARAKRIIEDAALSAPVEVTVFEQFIRAAEPVAAPEPAVDEEPAPKPTKKKAAAPKKKAAPTKKKAAAKTPAKKKAAAKAPAKKKAAAAAPAKKKTAPAKKKAAAKAPAKKKTVAKAPAKKKSAKSAAKKKTKA